MAIKVSEDLIALAHRLADASGAVIRSYFRSDFHIHAKQDQSPVTVADQEAEEALRAILTAARPGDGIHGEEGGSTPGDTGYLWVLDPIDGTKAFATGRPLFGTLIGLIHNGTPILGVLDQPIRGERWVGAKGHGTTLNGKRCQVRVEEDIARTSVSTTGPDLFDWDTYIRFFKFLKTEPAFSLYGGDCYSYGQLAGGWLDGIVEGYMKLHDYAALIPIVEEAGGIITNWEGKPLRTEAHWDPEQVMATGGPALHARLQKVLKG